MASPYWTLVLPFTVTLPVIWIKAKGITVKLNPFDWFPPTVTMMVPEVIFAGTGQVIEVADHAVGVQVTPWNVTVLVLCVEPKFMPVIVIGVPVIACTGVTWEITGETPEGVTVNVTPLEAIEDTVTTTFPVVAPTGTLQIREVAVHVPQVPAEVPLNVAVEPPWVEPKPLPVIVTAVPTRPTFGDRPVIITVACTVNVTPFEAPVVVVKTTGPVVAPEGTVQITEVADQVPQVPAEVPLNVTVDDPWEDPKLLPAIVTEVVVTGPAFGDRLVITGNEGVVTVKLTPFEAPTEVVTTTFPVVAPVGTVQTRDAALQLPQLAVIPLNWTKEVPWVEPKLLPAIVVVDPTIPALGDRLLTIGRNRTVKLTPELAWADTVTTTLPVVAPVGTAQCRSVLVQEEQEAVVPLNVTVLEPWLEPKVVPAIATEVPTTPLVGDKDVIAGVTVNEIEFEAFPPTVAITLPVVAAEGTRQTMLVAPQLVTEQAVPLNVKALEPWVAAKPVPVVVTEVPTGPDVTERLDRCGVTVNVNPLLAVLLTVTTTAPVVAPEGTVTPIDVEPQELIVRFVPFRVAVDPPWVEPKPVPVIVNVLPISPEEEEIPVICGGAVVIRKVPMITPDSLLAWDWLNVAA
jgi:hypothetical protein